MGVPILPTEQNSPPSWLIDPESMAPEFVQPPSFAPQMVNPSMAESPFPIGGLKGAIFGALAGAGGMLPQFAQQLQQTNSQNAQAQNQAKMANAQANMNADYRSKMAEYKAKTDYQGDLLDLRVARANQEFRMWMAKEDQKNQWLMSVAKASGTKQSQSVLNEGLKQGLYTGQDYVSSSPAMIESINSAYGQQGNEPIPEVAALVESAWKKAEGKRLDMLHDNMVAASRLDISVDQQIVTMVDKLQTSRRDQEDARALLDSLKDQFNIQTEQDWIDKLFKSTLKDSDTINYRDPNNPRKVIQRSVGALQREVDRAVETIETYDNDQQFYQYLLDKRTAGLGFSDEPVQEDTKVDISGNPIMDAMGLGAQSDSTKVGQ